MADNTELNPGSGGDIAATDDIAGVKYQRVKFTLGADGINDGDVHAGNPMPVAGAVNVDNFPAQTGLTDAQLRAAPVPISAYGELIEALEAMRMAIASLSRTIGQAMPDTAGRMRVNVETGAVTASLAANQTLAIVTTLTNQTQIGGLAATEHIPSLMRLGADSARRNITVS